MKSVPLGSPAMGHGGMCARDFQQLISLHFIYFIYLFTYFFQFTLQLQKSLTATLCAFASPNSLFTVLFRVILCVTIFM